MVRVDVNHALLVELYEMKNHHNENVSVYLCVGEGG